MDKEKPLGECSAKRNRNGIQSVGALLANFSSVYGIFLLPAEDEDLTVILRIARTGYLTLPED